jgi:hypothetical protein
MKQNQKEKQIKQPVLAAAPCLASRFKIQDFYTNNIVKEGKNPANNISSIVTWLVCENKVTIPSM